MRSTITSATITSAPAETREFSKGKLELFHLGESTLGKATFEPGWKWSECVKPIAGTDSCESGHTGYQVSGMMHIVPREGSPYDIKAGDSFYIPPGHDAWVVGQETVIALDFTGMTDYAKGKERVARPGRKH